MPSATARRHHEVPVVSSHNVAMELNLHQQFASSSRHTDRCTCALHSMSRRAPCEVLRTAHGKTANWRSDRTALLVTCVAINGPPFPLSAALLEGSLPSWHGNADMRGKAPPWSEPPSGRPPRHANGLATHEPEHSRHQCDRPCHRRAHLWAPLCLREQPSACRA
jgi:hypothetical protein